MHELGITQGLIDRAREVAQANGAARVTGLYLTMTAAADFTEDAIDMYFAMLAGDDDFFRGAQLHFEWQPTPARCLDCGATFEVRARHERCPRCDSPSVLFDAEAPMVQLTGIDVDDAA